MDVELIEGALLGMASSLQICLAVAAALLEVNLSTPRGNNTNK